MKVQNVRGAKIVQRKALSQEFASTERASSVFVPQLMRRGEEKVSQMMVQKEKRTEKRGREDNYLGDM